MDYVCVNYTGYVKYQNTSFYRNVYLGVFSVVWECLEKQNKLRYSQFNTQIGNKIFPYRTLLRSYMRREYQMLIFKRSSRVNDRL